MANCLEETTDGCVLYTGPSFPYFNIETDQYYDAVTVAILEKLTEYMAAKVELKCLFTGECDACEPVVDVPTAVQVLVDKLCDVQARGIRYSGSTYCLNAGTTSSSAANALGKTFSYTISPATTGSSVSYDLQEVVKSLPKEYVVGRISATITGKPKAGKSIIADSNKSYFSAVVPNDRFPISIDISMRVGTATGDLKLTKSIDIPTPMPGSHTSTLNVKDYTEGGLGRFDLESVVDALAAQVCSNTSDLSSYKQVNVSGCDGSYPSSDLRDIVSRQAALICDLQKRIENMEKVSYKTSAGCGTESCTGTLQEAITAVGDSLLTLEAKVAKADETAQNSTIDT